MARQTCSSENPARHCSDDHRLVLLRCFLVRQDVAGIFSARRINCFVAFLDVLDDSVLVDHKRRAISIATFFIEDAVVLNDLTFGKVTQNRKSYAVLFRELAIGINTVSANAENLCVVGFEFGDISLIRLHLLRSTTGEGKYVEGEYHVLLAFEIAESVPDAPLIFAHDRTRQIKVRRLITDLEVCVRRWRRRWFCRRWARRWLRRCNTRGGHQQADYAE